MAPALLGPSAFWTTGTSRLLPVYSSSVGEIWRQLLDVYVAPSKIRRTADSPKSLPLFTIDVCPWTWLPSNLRCANATLTHGCFTITIIATPLPIEYLACRRV